MVIQFDLTTIGQTQKIDSAKLALYSVDVKAENTCSLYYMIADWDLDVTWRNRKDGVAWQNRGGDYHTAEPLSVIKTVDYSGAWDEYDVTTFIKAVVNGTMENLGFLITVEYDPGSVDYNNFRKYASSEYSEQSLRPKLTLYSKGTTDTIAPTIQITAPLGGVYNPNNDVPITWKATDNLGVASRSIYFSANNGLSWTLVDSSQTNTGAFTWQVPTVESKQCVIAMSVYDKAGNFSRDTTENFTITQPVSIHPHNLQRPDAKQTVTIVNLQGRVISHFMISDITKLSLKSLNLPSGIYMIQISQTRYNNVGFRYVVQ